MSKTSIRHVSWRDGRPRFSPGPELRKAGFRSKDLRHPDGRWFSRGEALDWSDAFVRKLAGPKPARKRGVAGRPRPSVVYTLAQCCEDWFRSPKFMRPATQGEYLRLIRAKIIYADKTVMDFKQKIGVIRQHDPELWSAPVDAIDQSILFSLYEGLVAARGIATARGALATLSIALGRAKKAGRVTFRLNHGANPARGLGMATPPPRVRFATRREIEALVATADTMGLPQLGDMIMLGVWTGQRQADRLQLVDKGLLNGRRIFRQGKTGAIVAVRQAPMLEARLRASAERRRRARDGAGVVNPRVILDEEFWRPYTDAGDRYRKQFALVRSFAAAGLLDVAATAARGEPVWTVQPCPSLLGDPETGVQEFVEADLRDTAVVWMALAGSTVPEIVSITGHTLESATRILRHYLARHPEMADTAIGKMIAWYEADGETEIGL